MDDKMSSELNINMVIATSMSSSALIYYNVRESYYLMQVILLPYQDSVHGHDN